MRKVLFSLLTALVIFGLVGIAPVATRVAAQEDLALKCSIPEHQATLDVVPTAVALWFTQDVTEAEVQVFDMKAKRVDDGDATIDGAQVSVALDADALAANLANSTRYRVKATVNGEVFNLSFRVAAGASTEVDEDAENPCVEEEVVVETTPEATEEATEEATAEVTEEATVEPTAEVTEEATVEPTVEVTEEPTAEVTEEATAEPTAEVTEEATVEPTIEATVEPTAEVTEEATADAAGAEATEEATVEATEEATEEPTAEVTEEATEEPTAEVTEEATEEPTAEATEEVVVAALGEATVTDTIGATEFTVGVPADYVSDNVEGYFLKPVVVFAKDDATIESYVADADSVAEFVVIYTTFTNADLSAFGLTEDADSQAVIGALIREDSAAEEAEEVTVAGAPALKVAFSNATSGKSGVFYLVSFAGEEGATDYLLIQGSAPSDEWANYEATFQAVVDSIALAASEE